MKTFLYGFATGAALLAIVALISVGLVQAEAKARIDVANVAAEHFQIAYVAVAGAYEERAFVVTKQKELMNQLEASNEELARLVRDRDARILSLVDTEARLEAELDSSATILTPEDDGSLQIHLDESVVLNNGGYVRVLGSIEVIPSGPGMGAYPSLGVLGSFPLSVVITEQPNGELAVFAYTGDDRLRIAAVDVTTVPAQRGSGIFKAIGDALSSPAPWIGAAVGAGACLLLSGGFGG
jgi:hypothetical protein